MRASPVRHLSSSVLAWLAGLAVAVLFTACGPGTIEEIDPDGGQTDGGHDGGGEVGSDGGGDIDPSQDSDGDGLPDVWELAAGDAARLDPYKRDSDGDGTPDGAEDYDGDGLSNLEELAAARFSTLPEAPAAHPLRKDLLIELDSMAGRAPEEEALRMAARAFAALPLQNPDGSSGVTLHVIPDEQDLPAQEFDGSFEQRWNYLAAHGPKMNDGLSPPLPLRKMVHVMVVSRRQDIPDRGGEVVAAESDPERAGVFVYRDVIEAYFPACERTMPPVLPAITVLEMTGGTLIHEVGHTLQLGHDTEAGGGVNNFNIMSVPGSCGEAQMRSHGADNHDPALGAIEESGEARFSAAASQLMRFTRKLSADTAAMEDEDGYEM